MDILPSLTLHCNLAATIVLYCTWSALPPSIQHLSNQRWNYVMDRSPACHRTKDRDTIQLKYIIIYLDFVIHLKFISSLKTNLKDKAKFLVF